MKYLAGSLWFLACLGCLLGGRTSTSAQTPPDLYLYYQRTHDGLLPPPGVDPFDHSGETAEVIGADTVVRPVATITRLGGPGAHPLVLRDNGVDSANLGKGDWIWQMPQTMTHLGVSTVQEVVDYERGLGMQWITVKCGDGASIWTQFSADLITRAHAAGLKIFGWAYAYGNNPAGEANVAINALNLGADGFIIDAEIEYETNATRYVNAASYCQQIRASYPNRFLAHAPFPYVSYHSGFPYVVFGTNCDAVMPQDYWGAFAITPAKMITDMDSQWTAWQNGLSGANRNAIKPIVPLAQSYAPVAGAEITAFVNGLKSDAAPTTVGGYQGVSFWDAQERTADMDDAVRGAIIGSSNIPPYFVSQPVLSRAVDSGTTVSFAALAAGSTPIGYQWRFNGASLDGATNAAWQLSPAQATNTGNYSVVASNALGSVTSTVVGLIVFPPQIAAFADDFDSDTSANWTVNRSSADTRVTFHYDYSADGIPAAPHAAAGTTRGLKFEANLTGGAVAALSASPDGQQFSGDYRLHFDLWLNANGPFPGGGTGSTEFLTAGLGTAGNRVEWTGAGSTADGCWFSIDGEGGVSDSSTTSGDFCAYLGSALQAASTGAYVAGTNTGARGNLSAYASTAFPGGQTPPALQTATYAQQTGALNPGTIGFAWHDVVIARRGAVVDWVIDGVKLASLSNLTFAASNVFVGYWDPFASISDNAALSFGLVDNVRVEIPALPPSITAQPQDQAVKLGQPAGFSATAAGTPPLRYQWFFNGTNLPGATNSAYLIASAQTNDAGIYTVSVTNLAGAAASTNAELAVTLPLPAQFQTVSLMPDGSLRLLLAGDPGSLYAIRYSTNLIDWQLLLTLTNGLAGTSEVFDDAATNGLRFYRAQYAP